MFRLSPFKEIAMMGFKIPSPNFARASNAPYLSFFKRENIDHVVITKRYVVTFSKRKKYVPKHAKDKVPQDYDLVYENSLSNLIGPCRIASTAVGVMTLLTAAVPMTMYWSTLSDFDLIGLAIVATVTPPTIISVNLLSRRYFLRIYFNDGLNTFIGVQQSFLGRLKKIMYQPEKVDVLPSSKRGTFDKINVRISDQHFHLKSQDFILPKYFNLHTGHVPKLLKNQP